MLTKKGTVYSIVFFIMFPFCFQITKLLNQYRNYMNEMMADLYKFYLLTIIVGILAGVFIIVMLILHRKLTDSCGAGKWISLGIVIFNIVIGGLPMLVTFAEFPSIFIELFFYMFYKNYLMLIVMLLLFIVVDIYRGKKE